MSPFFTCKDMKELGLEIRPKENHSADGQADSALSGGLLFTIITTKHAWLSLGGGGGEGEYILQDQEVSYFSIPQSS